MSTPILDPSLPADHSPLSSGEMRGQFQAIQNRFDPRRRLANLTPLPLQQAVLGPPEESMDNRQNSVYARPLMPHNMPNTRPITCEVSRSHGQKNSIKKKRPKE